MSKASDYAFACEARRLKYPAVFNVQDAGPYTPVFQVGDDARLQLVSGDYQYTVPANEVEAFIAWLRATFEEQP